MKNLIFIFLLILTQNTFATSLTHMLPIAPLSYDVISQIAQGYEGVDADIEIFKKKSFECNGDLDCQAKITIPLYDKFFFAHGYSYMKTMLEYSLFLSELNPSSMQSNNRYILQAMGSLNEFSMYPMLCIKSEVCTEWLISQNYMTTSQVKEFHEIVAKFK
ncbi:MULTISPECIES: hypothetical protein [Aeromonas]|uniref:hypothetical protein n=1 Tax=Aeromonas TaxID=642 RepID=UPI0015FF5E4C|nr:MULTISPECIES: hypothetical protein [Aeromonas]MCE9951767.1 hypothetical protein [Aeromonas allosaccharophila]